MMEILNQETGAGFLHVPYRGTGQAMADLMAGRVDLLMQVALPASQRNEHHRQFEIGSRPGGVTGKDAETARIGVNLRPERDLHGEVGDAAAALKRLDVPMHWRS